MTTLAATYAAAKLAKLEACAERGIKPMQAGDNEVRCLNDQVELVGSPLVHSPEEVAWLQRAAGPLRARLRRVP